jgi:hypothetical protein
VRLRLAKYSVVVGGDAEATPPLRGQPKVTIKVEYEETKKYAIQARVLRHMGLLEALAANAADRYAWPNSVLDRGALMRRAECQMVKQGADPDPLL